MIKFTKMEGLGNDYIYINQSQEKLENIEALARHMSDRHFGVGSDGIILIEKSEIADFKMSIYNSDGSEAEMCGNGIRCVGKYVYDKKLTRKKHLCIETKAGIKVLDLMLEDGVVKKVRVDMGEPILEASKIPVLQEDSPVLKVPLKLLDKTLFFTCVSMGNPHAITFVSNLENFPIQEDGKIVEVDTLFPRRTNVEFVEIMDRENIKMRVWERGVGETMACGTGACASVVACILNHYTSEKVTVHLLGGELEIEWNQNDNHVYMTGPARTVFEGKFEEGEK